MSKTASNVKPHSISAYSPNYISTNNKNDSICIIFTLILTQTSKQKATCLSESESSHPPYSQTKSQLCLFVLPKLLEEVNAYLLSRNSHKINKNNPFGHYEGLCNTSRTAKPIPLMYTHLYTVKVELLLP